MAMRAYNNVSAEEKAWAYHLSMDRAEADYWNGLELAEEKGVKKTRMETARKMLSMGLGTHEQIADITGLPLEEVEKLAAGTEPVEA